MPVTYVPGPHGPIPVAISSGFSPSSSQSSAFLARATNVTSTTDKTNYDNLITGLVNDGIWTKLDALYIFAAPDSTTAKLNLVSSSFAAAYNGTPAESSQFTAHRGYKSDGSTVFLDTGFNPATAGGNFVQNSASFGSYNLTSSSGVDSNAAIGQHDNASNNGSDLYFQLSAGSGDNIFMAANSPHSFPSAVGTTQQGSWVVSRTASTTINIYRDSNSTAFGSGSTTSVSPISLNFYILASNKSGSAADFMTSGNELSMAFIASGFSSTDAVNFQNRVNTFMTAYGINVY